MSGVEHLEQMANDIGHFFQGQSGREDAILGIANHVRSYWTPSMRKQMMAHVRDGATHLDELPREAFCRLMEQPASQPLQTPGGDAG